MPNKLSYIILEGESLILEYYNGEFLADELIEFKRKIGQDKKYNSNYNVISDIRDTELLFDVDEVKLYIKFLSENEKHIGIRKTAMITNTPKQVITSMAYDMLKEKLPMIYRVYSTLEAAYTFIGLTAKEIVKVDSLMKKLKSDSNSIL